MNHIIVLLFICLFNAFIVALTGRRFGYCMPVSLMSMSFIMYIMQFVTGSFKPAYILMIVIAIAGIPLAILRWRTFRKNYFSWGGTRVFGNMRYRFYSGLQTLPFCV